MESISKVFNIWLEEKRLLYITVVIKRKGRRAFDGRVIHFSADEEKVLFYNKGLSSTESYLFKEINNIEPAKLLS